MSSSCNLIKKVAGAALSLVMLMLLLLLLLLLPVAEAAADAPGHWGAFGMVTGPTSASSFMSTSLDDGLHASRIVSEGFAFPGQRRRVRAVGDRVRREDGRRLPQRGGRQPAVAVPGRELRRRC